MGPHTLRHTCASVRVNLLNETLESVRDHLGHSSVTTTELYENPLPVGESRLDPFEVADRIRGACVPPYPLASG
jgi:integrase